MKKRKGAGPTAEQTVISIPSILVLLATLIVVIIIYQTIAEGFANVPSFADLIRGIVNFFTPDIPVLSS